MKSLNFNELNNSKIKSHNILSKTLIIVFILINLFNFLPIDISNPRWANNFSLLFIDSFSILLLGIWFHKQSTLEISFLEKKSREEEKKGNLITLITKKNGNFKNLIKVTIFSLVIINLLQIYIFIRGTNIIDYKLKLNLETIKYQYKSEKPNKEYSNEDIEKFIQKANKASFASASDARTDLIKSILKIFTLSSIYGISIKLIEKA